jgi:Escherichia/Staphylococcus phage prohead protease
MKPDRFSLPLALKAASDGLANGEIVGYGATFDLDHQRDMILPGAFRSTLAAHRTKGTQPMMLWGHDPDQPLGKWNTAKEDANGLYVRGRLSLGVQKANDVRALARDGVLGLSIGFVATDTAYVNRVRQIKQLDLYEVSFTPMPANPQAKITAAKSGMRPDTVRALENALHEIGFSVREAKMMAPAALAAIKRNDPSLELASLIEAAAQTFSISKEKV